MLDTPKITLGYRTIAEVTALSQEITRIACRTTFGGKKVLSGFGTTESLMTATTGKINFQVGSNHDDLQTLDMNIYKNDRSGTVDKGKTVKASVNALGDTKGEFLKKAADAEKAYKAADTLKTSDGKDASDADKATARQAVIDQYGAYLNVTTDKDGKVTGATAKTADDWLTNAAGDTKAEFTKIATDAGTAYAKIADDDTTKTDDDSVEVNGKKFTFTTSTQAERRNEFLAAYGDYLKNAEDGKTKIAKTADDFTAVQSKQNRAIDASGNTKIDDTGKEVAGWKQAKEDVNVFKDTASASKGYSLENLMKAVGLNGGNSGSASFMVNVDGTTAKTNGAYTVFDVRTSSAAQATLASIDKVINLIDTKRGDFGALENRMSSTISNQTNIMNNESDARSRIRDTDYAEEASNLSAQSIVQQAASSMLTKANSLPQMALSLLGCVLAILSCDQGTAGVMRAQAA